MSDGSKGDTIVRVAPGNYQAQSQMDDRLDRDGAVTVAGQLASDKAAASQKPPR